MSASFGAAFRRARAAARLTQEEVARRIGLDRPIVTRIEAGKHVLRLDTAARVARALGVPLVFDVDGVTFTADPTAPIPEHALSPSIEGGRGLDALTDAQVAQEGRDS